MCIIFVLVQRKIINKTMQIQTIHTETTKKGDLNTVYVSDRQNCKKHYIGEVIVFINGVDYTLTYSEWLDFRGNEASGWNCRVDENTILSDSSEIGLINQIKNYKPLVMNPASFYGKGEYNGD